MKRLTAIAWLFTVCMGMQLHAADTAAKRGELKAVIVDKAPVLDGTLKDPLWMKCPELVLGDPRKSAPDPNKAVSARVLFGPKDIFIAMTMKEKDTENIRANITKQDGNLWEDDAAEFFISPNLEESGYYQISVNLKGTVYDMHKKGFKQDKAYASGTRVKTSVQKGVSWTLTAAVPLKKLDAWAGKDQNWRLNLIYSRQKRGGQPLREYSWSNLGSTNFHTPHGFGRISGVSIPKLADGVARERDPSQDPSKFVPKPGPGEVKLNAVADIWLSDCSWEGENERLMGMGKCPKFKLKSIQEMAAIRFDAKPAAGREVLAATLYLRKIGGVQLRYFRISTVAQDWKEGDTVEEYGKGSGACYNYADFETKKWWSFPHSQFCDVIMTAGNTLCHWTEHKKLKNDWIAIDLTPELIYAHVVGDTDGLAIMDGGTPKLNNNFFHSVQSKGFGPFIVAKLGKPLAGAPKKPVVKAEPAPKRSRLGAGAIKVTIEKAENVFCWKLAIDGEPLERYWVKHPNPAGPTTFHVEDLAPGKKLKLSVTAVSAGGKRSAPTEVEVVSSAALELKQKLEALKAPTDGAEPAAVAGKMKVWPFPGLIKIPPEKAEPMHPDIAEDFRKANAVWDGKAIQLFGAKGEYVSFQLCIERLGDPLTAVKVVPQILKGPGDATIGGTEIELFRNWYTLNAATKWQPAYPVPMAHGQAFSIPDPKYKRSIQTTIKLRKKKPQRITAAFPDQQNQTVYVDIYIPKDAKVGKYAGAIAVEAEGAGKTSFPIKLEVIDLVLPDRLSFWPELNAYKTAPRSYYVVAHQHRCVLNAGRPRPALKGKGKDKKVVWTRFDSNVGPLLSGEAFKSNRRSGTPVEVMYLPFTPHWPAGLSSGNYLYKGRWRGGLDIIEEHYMTVPRMEKVMSQNYIDENLAVQKQFIEHFKEKGWTYTEMQFFMDDKATHRIEYGTNSWWTVDEPYHWLDWHQLIFMNQMWMKGIKALGADTRQWVARADISRPNWQGRVMEGLLNTQYGGIGSPANNRRMRIFEEEQGIKINDYGSANGDTASNTQSVVKLLNVYLSGGNAHLPWQTLGSDKSLDLGDRGGGGGNSLLVPGKRVGKAALGDMRLKAFRDGQQIIEYLVMLGKKHNLRREQLKAMVLEVAPFKIGRKKGASLEDADAKRESAMVAWRIAELRRSIAKLLVE